jgi:PAS domain S-box-containing protein
MSAGVDGEPAGATAGRRRPSPTRVVESALALAALIGLGVGLYLGHRIVTMFGASVLENQVRSEHRQRSWSLQQHAADMTAPGNDIFQSRNVRPETRKFYTSRAVLKQALTDSRREIVRTIPPAEARILLDDLLAIRRAVKPLVAEVRRIFQGFRDDAVDQALRRQATMNRRAASLRAVFGTLERHFDEIEDRRVAAQASAARRLVAFERWTALLLLAGIGGMVAYGRRAEARNDRLAAEQRRSLAALRESEGRKAAILASALDAIVTMDHEGRIVEFNPAAERIFGHRRDDVLGRPLAQVIVPPAARAGHEGGLARFLATGNSVLIDRRVEVMALRASGEEFPAELAISALAGERPTFTATIRDITDRRRAQAEIAAARDHALEAVRVKSEFMANMSHEIRTPMNIVFGMTEMLLDSPLTAEQGGHVEALRRNAEGLLRIIDDVLDFSKIEAGKVALESIPFALRDVVEDTVGALLARADRRGLALVANVQPDAPPRVLGDPTRLRQVLLNLVDNAIKFTERGHVRVDVTVESATAATALMRFAVNDTGIGIPREKQAAVFEPFTQADGTMTRRYGGTGLGLTICVQLVTLMGGRLWLESEPGRGTTFFFTVPMDVAAARPRAVA